MGKWLKAATISALVLILVTTVVACGGHKSPEKATFPDANVEAAVTEAIGIHQCDLDGLTRLEASGRGITDLTGLERCTSLTHLYLADNQISDISPLSNLTGLVTLGLPDNQISDISPISNLTRLTDLGLSGNQISDISPLENLTSLTLLNLWDNQISDISPLENLTSLTLLLLEHNQISDIKPLVDNGLSEEAMVCLTGNPLSADSINTYIPQLRARRVSVFVE